MPIFLQEQKKTIQRILIYGRRKKGFSQDTVARLMGIGQSYYSELECDPLKMKVEQLLNALNILDLKLEDVFKPPF